MWFDSPEDTNKCQVVAVARVRPCGSGSRVKVSPSHSHSNFVRGNPLGSRLTGSGYAGQRNTVMKLLGLRQLLRQLLRQHRQLSQTALNHARPHPPHLAIAQRYSIPEQVTPFLKIHPDGSYRKTDYRQARTK